MFVLEILRYILQVRCVLFITDLTKEYLKSFFLNFQGIQKNLRYCVNYFSLNYVSDIGIGFFNIDYFIL